MSLFYFKDYRAAAAESSLILDRRFARLTSSDLFV
jgi:hypothetical protein